MPRTRVKFCGIMRPEDAAAAARAGADAIGMILHANAKRLIPLSTAMRVVAALPPFVSRIGVFVNAEPAVVDELANALTLNAVQLHGDETPDYARRLGHYDFIKAIKLTDDAEATLDAWRKPYSVGDLQAFSGILIDSPAGGGTGEKNDFSRVRRLIDSGAFAGLPPLIVAGGLKPENVGEVVTELQPFAVDTSSGIEAEFGKKSPELMRAFYDAVAKANR
ncbi:MAG: phosphoribosylanthranilate isomerase [Tepidisphaeraceae bacterium]